MANSIANTLSLTWSRLDGEQTRELQLGTLARGQSMYRLSWAQNPTPVDESLPPGLVDALSKAFCSVAGLSFLSELLPDGQDAPRASPAMGWLRRLAGQGAEHEWQRQGNAWIRPIDGLNEPVLLCTDNPTHARSLFLIGAWHMAASQIVFFCTRDAMPPSLPDALVRRAARGKDWSSLTPEISRLGLQGVLTQGHDGAYLGLLPLTPDFEQCVARAVADEAKARGWQWNDAT